MQEAYLIPIQDIANGVQRGMMMKESLRLPTLDETLKLAITYDNSKMIESLLAAGASDRGIIKMPQDRVPEPPSPRSPWKLGTESSSIDFSTEKIGGSDRHHWMCHECSHENNMALSTRCVMCGHMHCVYCSTH